MARLRIGFIPIEGGHYYKEALQEVTHAEDLGFDSVWMEEHHSDDQSHYEISLTAGSRAKAFSTFSSAFREYAVLSRS